MLRSVIIADVKAVVLIRVVVACEIMHLLSVEVVKDMLAEVAVWEVDGLDVLEQLLQLHVIDLLKGHATVVIDLRPRVDLELLLVYEIGLDAR